MARGKSAFRIGIDATDRFRNLTKWDLLDKSQQSVMAFVIADVIRDERHRCRRHYRNKVRRKTGTTR